MLPGVTSIWNWLLEGINKINKLPSLKIKESKEKEPKVKNHKEWNETKYKERCNLSVIQNERKSAEEM